MSRKKKICLIASSGGHWEELMCLRELENEYQVFFITEKGGQIEDTNISNVYMLSQINRFEKNFFWHFINLFIKEFKIIFSERPSSIITTGALIAFPACLWVKLCGGKVIYIESFARVHEKSLTGKLIYYFADLFVVQWESMLEVYPKAKYYGSLF